MEGTMGGVIPSGHDLNVITKLDTLFSDPHLGNLRTFVQNADPGFFRHGRHLARISLRLKIWPDGIQGRWYYFLKELLTNAQAAQNNTTVAEVIREALSLFVADANCKQIGFHVMPDDGSLAAGINYRADITPDPNAPPAKAYNATIMLVCRQEIPAGVHDPDPGPDGGELPPVQPNL
jgi:hypothetical protein